MSDSRWIEDVEELLARSLGAARPTPDFASWRRQYIEAVPAIRARTQDWPAAEPARRTAGGAAWLASHKAWSAAAAILVAVIGVSAYWLLKEWGGGPVAAGNLADGSGRMPVVSDTRGLVLALPEGDGKEVQLTAGSPVPAGRTLWTCPWGASSVRYADGTSVTLDRSTTAVFSEAADTERVSLKDGILFVTRRPSKVARERIFVERAAGLGHNRPGGSRPGGQWRRNHCGGGRRQGATQAGCRQQDDYAFSG